MTPNNPPTTPLCLLSSSSAGFFAVPQTCWVSFPSQQLNTSVNPFLEITCPKTLNPGPSPSGHLLFSLMSPFERCLPYLSIPTFSYNILFSITSLLPMLSYLSNWKHVMNAIVHYSRVCFSLLECRFCRDRKLTCLVSYYVNITILAWWSLDKYFMNE